uniref:Uncharacterized protein n=1 Tax=Nelumbo nucifera TaxID=4432 RepID=A0A822YS23_NELNU|nr:TPA_asm: hypothetical protein HUJ06_004849 [Nelumbo nucifera]
MLDRIKAESRINAVLKTKSKRKTRIDFHFLVVYEAIFYHAARRFIFLCVLAYSVAIFHFLLF